MFKPLNTLLFILSVGGVLAFVAWVFPKDGVVINDEFSINFASLDDLFAEDTIPVLDVEELLESYEEPFDSISFKDSLKTYEWNERQKRLRIHYPENESVRLPNFFSYLYNFKKGKSKIKIIHYGDSQIEGDRISSYIRDKFQDEYGGFGPGYIPGKMVVPSMSIKQSQSDNWNRYTIFGRKDTTVTHKNFGMYGIFSRFTPAFVDTNNRDTAKAWIELKRSYIGYSRTRTYRNFEMLYGNATHPFVLRVFADEELIFEEILQNSGNSERLSLELAKTPKVLRLEFEGVVSPDIYALRLESTTGAAVDNVAMRGSSGTVFTKISRAQLSQQFQQSKPQLILLQYGGNTVPYIKSKKRAEQYGNWFKGQINYLKSLNPQADIVVIGPSDMATKVKTEYVTFPYLPEVRDALKKATLDAGCGFWDIYEVMGGLNSMSSWVATNPPLAGKDYVHFTPRGAKRIAELFYEALEKDYILYRDEQIRIEEEAERLRKLEEEKVAEEKAAKEAELKKNLIKQKKVQPDMKQYEK